MGGGGVLVVLAGGHKGLEGNGRGGGGVVGAHHHHVHRGPVDDVVVEGGDRDRDAGRHVVIHRGVDCVTRGRGDCSSVHS